MRGAWMWPAFAVLTVLDGLLIHWRPLAGDGTALVPALLLAFFFNLVVVAVLAPMAGALLRRRRRDLPRLVSHDYAGTVLLGVVSGLVLLAGLLHGPAVEEGRRDVRAQTLAVHRYVLGQAPPEYRPHLAAADTLRLEEDLFRTCVPGDDPKRRLCLFVNTDQEPAGVQVDGNREPNSSFGGRRSGA